MLKLATGGVDEEMTLVQVAAKPEYVTDPSVTKRISILPFVAVTLEGRVDPLALSKTGDAVVGPL